MAYWPPYVCRNPSCKNHGASHPNCKCGPPAGESMYMMAEGGEISHFCSSDRPHMPDCEYHANTPDPAHDVPSAIAHMGILGLYNKGKGGLFDDIGTKGLGSGLTNFKSHINRGDKQINKHVESLFSGDKVGGADPDPDDREKVKDLISKGFLNQQIQSLGAEPDSIQNFAKGGDVESSSKLSDILPTHNLMLNAAKARAYEYLNSVRPQDMQPKANFDEDYKDHESERRYHRAIDIANKPLSVMPHIKNGSLLPEHVKHLNSMYPELKDHLDKKLTERILGAQLKKEKPSYKARQSLSMFLGAPVDGSFSPQMIQAAQAVFQNQAAAQQQAPAPTKNKKGTSSLSKASDNVWSDDQAAEKRQIKDR